MYYYQKHIGDYRSATAHLDLLHHGVYQYLMETCYMNEQPLPVEVGKVCRLCGARTQEEKEAVQNILDEFFTLTETGWVNSRIEKEINAYHANSDKNRTNGAKGGRPRKNKTKNNPVGFDSVSVGLENDANSKPNQKATINHKPITNNQTIVSSNTHEAENSIQVPIQFSTYKLEDHKRYSILECASRYEIQNDFIELGCKRFTEVPQVDLITMFTNFGDWFTATDTTQPNTPSIWLVKWFTWVQNNKDQVKRNREKQNQIANKQPQPEEPGYFMQMFSEKQNSVIDVTPDLPVVEGNRYA